MEEKIEELRKLYDYLETVIHILEGRFRAADIEGNATIKEQIQCFSGIGEELDDVMERIFDEHGSEICKADIV